MGENSLQDEGYNKVSSYLSVKAQARTTITPARTCIDLTFSVAAAPVAPPSLDAPPPEDALVVVSTVVSPDQQSF